MIALRGMFFATTLLLKLIINGFSSTKVMEKTIEKFVSKNQVKQLNICLYMKLY
jgi:hypothetical protein